MRHSPTSRQRKCRLASGIAIAGAIQSVFTEHPDGILIKDLSGRYVAVNPAGAAFVGRSREEILKKTDAELFPAALARRIAARDRRVLLTGMTESCREVVSHSATRSRTFRIIQGVCRSRGGRLAGLFSIVREVTSQRLMAETLVTSERRFHAFMDNSPTTVFMKDLKGRYVYVNRIVLQLFANQPADWLGKTDKELWPEQAAREIRTNDERVLSSGEALTALEAVPGPDGALSYWMTVKFPFVDARGQKYLAGVGLNVTGRKQIDDDLRRSEQQLWQLLGDREQLAQDLHDNIIQKIYAVGLELEHYKYHLAGSHPSFTTKPVEHAIGELNRVIQDVRSYIKGVDPGITQAMQFRTELARLVEKPDDIQSPHFEIKLDPLAASRLSLEQAKHMLFIVQEAVSNSLRHSNAKRGSISLRHWGNGVVLEVEDDGVGFDSEAAQPPGHGLRNIAARVRKLGGWYRIVSRHGQGVRIVVSVPRPGLA